MSTTGAFALLLAGAGTVVSLFVAIAALVTAITCSRRRSGAAGSWMLCAGCTGGVLVSLVFLVMSWVPFDSAPTIGLIVTGVNTLFLLLMALGLALLSPRAGAEQ